MKMKLILGIMILAGACAPKSKPETTKNKTQTFYVGTYTRGESEGIYKYSLNADGSMEALGLQAKTENPSFLALTSDRKYLLAVGEVGGGDKTGFVKSYGITEEGLEFLSETSSGGENPCYVGVNDDDIVAFANYSSGSAGLMKLEDGKLSALLDLQQHEGSGPNEKRQQEPHAHSAWFVPGSNDVLVLDLGTDEIWIYTLDKKAGKLVPGDPATLAMNPGSGPRHLDFHPNGKWIYVVNELDATVSLVQRNGDGQYELLSSVTTLPSGYTGGLSTADIHVSSDGKFVYASNRGGNNIAIYRIAKDGSLEVLGHEPVRGETPRNFALSPDERYLLVANQRTSNITCFARDSETGLLSFVSEIAAPSPVCIKFY